LLKTPSSDFCKFFKIKESSVPVFGQKKKHNEKIIIMKAVLFFLGGKILSNFDMKIMISTYRNDRKIWLELARFQRRKF
jgi:hypothetical protein